MARDDIFHGPTKVYRLFAADGTLLYIGVTTGTYIRFRQHQAEKAWWTEVDDWTVAAYPTRREALAVERAAIIAERPRYNQQWNEDNPERQPSCYRPGSRPRGTCPACHEVFAYNPPPSYGNWPAAMVRHHRVKYDATGRITYYGRCEGTSKPPVGVAA